MNKSLSILVAEDDPQDVFLFKRAFSHAASTCLSFSWGMARSLQGEPPFDDRAANPWPALLILDLTMPRVDGFEVLEWMREHKASSQIPVLAFSGVQNPTEISRAYALGTNFFLIKTADASKWVNVLHRVVEMYGLSNAVGPPMSATKLDFPMAYPDASPMLQSNGARVGRPR